MRVLFSSVLALGLVGALAGCGHMAGVCDNEDGCGCAAENGSCGIGGCGTPVDGGAPVYGSPVMKPEPIQKMPRGDSKLATPPVEVIPGL